MGSTELDNIAAILSILRPESLFALLVGIFFIVFLAKAIQKMSSNLQSSYPSNRTLFLQIATIFNFVIYIGGTTLLFYGVLQPPKEILLAIAGSLAVAIGISLKDIVASIVAGVVLLFDRPFGVGDRVTFGETYGEIVGIGLRTVKLVTLDDNLVTIPNSRFLTDIVASGNSGALDMMVVCDFYISLQADIDLSLRIVKEVVSTSRYAYLKKPLSVLIKEISVAERLALRLRAKAYVIDCRFEKEFENDIVTRVTKIFIENGIERPKRI